MNRILKYFLYSIIVCIIGCSKSLDYQSTNQSSQLVLYAFPIADSALSVHVSESANILSNNNYESIEDVSVFVVCNNELITQSTYPSNTTWYTFDEVTIKSNDTIKILCYTDNETKFYGETIIPETVLINNVDTITDSNSELRVINSETMNCIVQFDDPYEIKNYYQLRIDLETKINNNTTINTLDYNKDDQVFLYYENENDLLVDIDYQGTFNDDLINGKSYSLNLSIPQDSINITDTDSAQLKFYLFSLSDDYYEYYRSSISEDSYRENIFYQAQNVYSNIEGGVGLVGGLSVSTYTIPLK